MDSYKKSQATNPNSEPTQYLDTVILKTSPPCRRI